MKWTSPKEKHGSASEFLRNYEELIVKLVKQFINYKYEVEAVWMKNMKSISPRHKKNGTAISSIFYEI